MTAALVTRAALIACVRTFIGTPVVHQGQRRGVSCDCKGVLVGVATELDLPEARSLAAGVRTYPTSFKGRRMLQGLEEALVRVPEALPGDVLAILIGRDPNPRHLAILTEPGKIVHAYGVGVGRVTEVPLGHWRVHSCWTWPSFGETSGR